jgi:hypothetical protein
MERSAYDDDGDRVIIERKRESHVAAYAYGDPQGAPGWFLYTIEMFKNGRRTLWRSCTTLPSTSSATSCITR